MKKVFVFPIIFSCSLPVGSSFSVIATARATSCCAGSLFWPVGLVNCSDARRALYARAPICAIRFCIDFGNVCGCSRANNRQVLCEIKSPINVSRTVHRLNTTWEPKFVFVRDSNTSFLHPTLLRWPRQILATNIGTVS